MANGDQLEIIYASGEIEFYDLNPTKEVINIGRHPDNDIVLAGPQVADFHAMFDQRQKPYQIMLLHQSSEGTRLQDQPLSPHQFQPMQNWDTVQIEGHTLILVESNGVVTNPTFPLAAGGGSTGLSPTPLPATSPVTPSPSPPLGLPVTAMPNNAPPPGSRPEASAAPSGGSPPMGGSSLPATSGLALTAFQASPTSAYAGSGPVWSEAVPDYVDERQAIVTEVDIRETSVDVQQAVAYQVTILNGGPRVAAFDLSVQGLDPGWVTLSTASVSLRDGDRETIQVTVSPPRDPTSRAGVHHFGVAVTSPNYPNSYSRLGLTLVINPYYEFTVDELSPKTRTISWFKRSSDTLVTVHNYGNSEAAFSLEGRDDERACSYEFEIPGEPVTLTGQAPLQLPMAVSLYEDGPQDHVAAIPLRIIPHSRPFALRKRTHRFTVTIAPGQGSQPALALPGEVRQRPLLGILSVLVLGLLFLFLCGYLFQPWIYTFTVNGEARAETIIEAGEEVDLGWEGSYFTSLRINNSSGSDIGRLDDTTGNMMVSPTEDTTYTLEGSNLLSALLTFLGKEMERTVLVDPVFPRILTFEAAPNDIVTGEEVILSWEVAEADSLTLFTNDVAEDIPASELNGQRVVSPNNDTTYRLQASNTYGTPQAAATVIVVTPTGTPIPTPNVEFFTANPLRVLQGEPVNLNWLVEGADSVTINPIGPVPPEGPISHSPQESTLYTLLVAKEGAPSISMVQEVIVDIPTGTPSPTATPAPPTIVDFSASKTDLVVGEGGEDKTVTLFWTVQGETTDIQLANSSNVVIQSQLEPEAQLDDVPVDENSTFFTLIAFNGDKSNRKSVTLNIATPTPTGTPLPTATATPVPPEITEFIIVSPGSPQVVDQGGTNPHIYEVQKGTTVTFQWRTNSATTKVIFTEPGGVADVGTVPVGQVDRSITLTGNLNYTLIGENAEGQTTPPQQIQIQVVNPPAPDPPFSVSGTENDTATPPNNAITWNWTFSPGKSDIIGFRVYRADVPPGNSFVMVKELLQKDPKEWTDNTVTKTCGKVYYVVALFADIQGVTQESVTSTSSWFSMPCP